MYQSALDYMNLLFQNLPPGEDVKLIFTKYFERFKKDFHASMSSLSKFTSIPGTENMPMGRIPPWFSPTKLHKKHIALQRRSDIHQESNERVVEQEEFHFHSISHRKKKKKKVLHRSSIAIQEESTTIMEHG